MKKAVDARISTIGLISVFGLLFSCSTGEEMEAPKSLQFSPATIEHPFYTDGKSSPPSVDWGGEKGVFSISTSNEGFSIDSNSGEVSWQKDINLGLNNVVVIAKNSIGETSFAFTVNHLFSGNFSGGYNRNVQSPILTDNDYHLAFSSDGTLTVRDKSSSGSGTWELLDENGLNVGYKYLNSNSATLDAEVQFSENKWPIVHGIWKIPGSSSEGIFEVELVR